MTVETASYISQLNSAYPDTNDVASEGDNHMRLVKSVLQTQFPNLGATAVTPTAAALNTVGITQSTSDSSTAVASTACVDAKILASSGITAVLPGQGGNSGKFLTTNGTAASWGSVGLTLLATLTPTAAAAVNSLTSFTSSYDEYIIVGSGIGCSADDILSFRLAVAGALDTGSNYYNPTNLGSGQFTTASSTGVMTGTVTGAGLGCNFWLRVNNANSTTLLKSVTVDAVHQSAALPGYIQQYRHITYPALNAITGIGFFWASAANFDATGSIKIYGVSKV